MTPAGLYEVQRPAIHLLRVRILRRGLPCEKQQMEKLCFFFATTIQAKWIMRTETLRSEKADFVRFPEGGSTPLPPSARELPTLLGRKIGYQVARNRDWFCPRTKVGGTGFGRRWHCQYQHSTGLWRSQGLCHLTSAIKLTRLQKPLLAHHLRRRGRFS